MASGSVFARVEKKYRMNRSLLEEIMPMISLYMQEDDHCTGGRTYRICNLYYDTSGDDVIRESLEKPYFKEKLRMRSYGFPENDQTEVFLELKRKINGVVSKRRARLPYRTAEDFLSSREIPDHLSYMNRQVLGEIREYLSHNDVRQTTLISYERMAWYGKEDSSFRLTFDTNIRYLRGASGLSPDPSGNQQIRSYPSGDQPIIPGPKQNKSVPGKLLMPEDFVLMEAKVEGAFPLWFSRIISRYGICPQSFSKYGVAYKTYLKEYHFNGDESIDVLGHI